MKRTILNAPSFEAYKELRQFTPPKKPQTREAPDSERKESTKHCCGNGCLWRDSAEHEEETEAPIDKRITQNNTADADRQASGLLEEIVSRGNLNRAYKRVKKNKGAGGVDEMKVDELLQYLKDNGEEIRQSVLAGKYQPQPVRRVEIPKDKGRKGFSLRVHAKSKAKMKARVRRLTSRRTVNDYEKWKADLKRYVVGWVNYYKLADSIQPYTANSPLKPKA